jgi:hypothetical protein
MSNPLDVEAAAERETQRKDAQRADALNADKDFTWVMSDARGRRVIWQQLADAGLYRTSFNVDPSVMAFSEGKRDVGLRLLATLIRVTPAQYLLMQKENTVDHS